jgi:hypothetical protein
MHRLRFRPLSNPPVITAIGLLLGSSLCATADAQTVSPYTFRASQNFKADDNLYRTTNNTVSDKISATGVGFLMDQTFSRQRVRMDLSATHNSFKDNTQLNNNEYGTEVRWNMATGNNISGDFSWKGEQKLADFTPGATEKNIQRNNILAAKLQLGMESLWALEGGGAHRKLTFSSKASDAAELSANSGNFGVRYNPSDLVSLGLGYRKTSGEYVNTPDDFDRNDIDLTAKIALSGISSFNGRISKTKETHTFNKNLDANPITSAIGMEWKPGGPFSLDLQALRDTNAGIGTSESTLETSTEQQAPLTTSLQGIVHWDVSPRVLTNLTLSTSNRKLEAFTPSGYLSGSDTTRFIGVGVNYFPARWVKLQATFGKESRSTNSPLSADYDAKLGSIGAELRFN